MNPGQFTERLIFKRETNAGTTTYSEQDFGSLSASGDQFTFAENIGDAVLAGDTVEFREVSTFGNRGPFEVLAVGSNYIQVDADLTTATDETWYMDVESDGVQELGKAWAKAKPIQASVADIGLVSLPDDQMWLLMRRPGFDFTLNDFIEWKGKRWNIQGKQDVSQREPNIRLKVKRALP